MKKISQLLLVFLLTASIISAQDKINRKNVKEVNSYIELITTGYEPGTTVDIVFSHNYSSPDGNWIKAVSIQFPEGVTVNSATSCIDSGSGLIYNGETGNGVLSTWGDVTANMGTLNLTGEFLVNVTIDESFSGAMVFNWKITGDNFGAAPHFNEGILQLFQPVNNDLGIQKISDYPTDIVREGETYEIMARVYNYGLNTQIGKTITLDIDGVIYTEILSDIEAGDYQPVIFSGLVAESGKHTHKISVPADENSSNDNTITFDLVFAPNNYNTFEFEDESYNQVWTMTTHFGVRQGGAYGTYSEKYLASYFDESDIGTYVDTIKTIDPIHISDNSTNEFMSFYVRGYTVGVTPNSLKVMYSEDNENWEELQNINYSDDYELVYIDLSSALPEGDYYIAIEAVNTTAEGDGVFTSSQYIDNLIIPELKNVSVKEIPSNFSIYPNPTQHNFFVEVDKKYALQIIDLSGKIVSSKELNIGKNSITIQNEGVYILKFIGDDKVFTSRIVINN